jgi:hypothetical protein
MPVMLEKLVKALEHIDIKVKTKRKFADKWLGVFEGAIHFYSKNISGNILKIGTNTWKITGEINV